MPESVLIKLEHGGFSTYKENNYKWDVQPVQLKRMDHPQDVRITALAEPADVIN